jgi:hypothetical protein
LRRQNSAGRIFGISKADVLGMNLKHDQFDIVFSGLFSHHFADEEWVHLIKKCIIAPAGLSLPICTGIGSCIMPLFITHVLTRNKMVRIDGPLSVKRSFKRRRPGVAFKKGTN